MCEIHVPCTQHSYRVLQSQEKCSLQCTINCAAQAVQVLCVLRINLILAKRLQIVHHVFLYMLSQGGKRDVATGHRHERQLCLHQTAI